MEERSEPLTISDLWDAVWRQKRFVIGFTLACVVVTILVSFLLTPVYRAEVLLAPVVRDGGGAVSSLPRQYADLMGIASRAGASGLGREELIALLRSRDFTSRFIRDHELMPVLYAGQWDSEAGSWTRSAGSDTPTIWQACDLFGHGVRGVSENEKTGLVTLSIEWTDPELTARWANGFIRSANEYLRARAIEEGERSITFLTDELESTTASEVRDAIFSLMESQMQRVMVANVQEDYGYRILDSAVVPEVRVRPNRKLMAVAALVVGGAAAMGLAVVVDARGGAVSAAATTPRSERSRADADGSA